MSRRCATAPFGFPIPIIAELIVTTGTFAVLDMGQMRKAEQARLVADLLDYLFTHNREPFWLVLEEADAFAPQQPMGELTRVLGEVDRIARRGRNFGFRLISITQGPAKLNKDVLTQLSTLIALGVTSPQDRDAIKTWVDGNADREQAKRVYDSLARLPVGGGWIWAPDHDLLKHVKSPAIQTLDTSKTPKAGDARITAPVLATADLAKIANQIQAIQATQGSTSKRSPKGARTPKPALVPVNPPKQTAPPAKEITASTPAQIGAAILAARTTAGLSQNDLAARLKTAQTNIARLERGGSIPSTDTLQRIAKATGHKLVITFTRTA
jgi:ribosome-binding protein aMBF1 (putative translation factor)